MKKPYGQSSMCKQFDIIKKLCRKHQPTRHQYHKDLIHFAQIRRYFTLKEEEKATRGDEQGNEKFNTLKVQLNAVRN